MAEPVLTPEFVRENISDKPECNHLLDGVEFGNTRISLAVDLTLDKFNMFFIPRSNYNIYTFPSRAILLYGTLGVMFETQAALLARNTLTYNDGGVQIPVEERMQLYQSLAAMYNQTFDSSARAFKLQDNLESGWGQVSGDYARMPLW